MWGSEMYYNLKLNFKGLTQIHQQIPGTNNGSAFPTHNMSPKAAQCGGPGGASPWRSPRRGPRRALGEPPEARLSRRIIFTLLLSALVFLLVAPAAARDTIRIDKIAAVVEGEIITLSDIDKAILLFPVFRKKDQTEQEFYISILQDLIHYKAVYLEYRDELTLVEEDYQEVQTSIIKKLGAYAELMKVLRRFHMEWADFKVFITERVFYEKVLRTNFQLKITISFKEIETFYREQYLPMQQSLQLIPRSLIEMTPLIEAQLQRDRTQERMAGWLKEVTSAYSIENNLLED